MASVCPQSLPFVETSDAETLDVTMFQRGSTYIMSTKNGWKVAFAGTSSLVVPIMYIKRLLQL